MGTRALSPGLKRRRRRRRESGHALLPRLRMAELYLHSLHVPMSWCLINEAQEYLCLINLILSDNIHRPIVIPNDVSETELCLCPQIHAAQALLELHVLFSALVSSPGCRRGVTRGVVHCIVCKLYNHMSSHLVLPFVVAEWQLLGHLCVARNITDTYKGFFQYELRMPSSGMGHRVFPLRTDVTEERVADSSRPEDAGDTFF
jgi:hypothetical protein